MKRKKEKIIVVFILVAASIFIHLNSLSIVPIDGLVGWWRLDGNVLDSASTNHGNIVGNIDTTKDRFGVSGGAYEFDGNGGIIVPKKFKFQSFSVSYWVMAYPQPISWTSQIDKGRHGVYGVPGDNNGWAFVSPRASEGCGTLFEVYGYDSWISLWDHFDCNKWYHITGTFNGTVGKLYINGVLINSDNELNFTDDGLFDLGIGVNQMGDGGFFLGKIDDIRIYNRALSVGEISALYHIQSPEHKTKLLGEWDFDGNAKNSVNGQEGQVMGAKLTTDRFGRKNNAYFFDGHSRIIYPGEGFVDIGSNIKKYSLNAWFKTEETISQYTDIYLISKWQEGRTTPNRYPFNFRITDAYEYSAWYNGDHSCTASTMDVPSYLKVDPNDGKWHMMTSTFNLEKGEIKIYVDGILRTTRNGCQINDPIWNDADILFGSKGWADLFVGDLDDIKIYEGVLTKNQVSSLFNYVPPKIHTGSHTKLNRVCYFKDGNKCGAEIRMIELPCNFIRLEDCQNALDNPKTITLFEKIFGGIF